MYPEVLRRGLGRRGFQEGQRRAQDHNLMNVLIISPNVGVFPTCWVLKPVQILIISKINSLNLIAPTPLSKMKTMPVFY